MEEDDIPTFAARIKAKYPDYASVDDYELVEKVVRKHPVYASQVKLPQGFGLLYTSSGYNKIDSIYEEMGRKYNVDPNLLLEQGRQETSFNPDVFYGKRASSAGAVGAGQFMPGTAPKYGVTDRTDPIQSIEGQAKYMRKLLDDFDNDESLALAGYNAGEYRKALTKDRRVPNIPETQHYVKTIKEKLDEARSKSKRLRDFIQQSPSVQAPTPTTQPTTQPTPEAPSAFEAQLTVARDPKNMDRSGVFFPNDGTNAALKYANGLDSNWALFPDKKHNGTHLINLAKAKKLKLRTPKEIQEFIDKNPNAFKTLGIAVEDVGNDTQGVAITAENNGVEQASAVVRTPETAVEQINAYQKQFPDATIRPTTTDEIVQNRIATLGGTENVPPSTEPPMTVAGELISDPRQAEKTRISQAEQEKTQAALQARFAELRKTNPSLTVDQFNKILSDEHKVKVEKSKQEWLAKNPALAKFAKEKNLDPFAQETVDEYNTSRKKYSATKSTAKTQFDEASFNQANKFLREQGQPELSREEFIARQEGNSKVGISLDPNTFTVDGTKITDYEIEAPAQGGGTIRFPREVGKGRDANGTVAVYRSEKGMSEEDAYRAALLNAGSRYGITPEQVNAQIDKLKSAGKNLFQSGKHIAGNMIAVTWDDLANVGVDVNRERRMEQSQNTLVPAVDVGGPQLVTAPGGTRYAVANKDTELPTLGEFVDQILGDRDQQNNLTEQRKKELEYRVGETQEESEAAEFRANVLKSALANNFSLGESEVITGFGLTAASYLSWLGAGGADLTDKIDPFGVLSGSIVTNALFGRSRGDFLGKFGNKVQKLNELSTPDNSVYKIYREVGNVAGALPAYAAVGVAVGGNPVLTFALTDALVAKGKGGSLRDTIGAGAKGAVMGAMIGNLSRFGTMAADGLLGESLLKVVPKVKWEKSIDPSVRRAISRIWQADAIVQGGGSEAIAAKKVIERELAKSGLTLEQVLAAKPGAVTGAEATAAANEAAKKLTANTADGITTEIDRLAGRKIARGIIEHGVPIGLATGIGYGVSAIEGGSTQDNLKNALLFGAMQALGSIFHKKKGEKLTPDEVNKADGTVVRVPDEKGKPHDLILLKENNELTVTDVTGKVPPEAIQGAVLPKPPTPSPTDSETLISSTEIDAKDKDDATNVKMNFDVTDEVIEPPKKDKFSKQPLEEVKAEGEVKYDGVDDFFVDEEKPAEKVKVNEFKVEPFKGKEVSEPITLESIGKEVAQYPNVDEAFKAFQERRDIPPDVAQAFADKYKEGNTPKQAFEKFYNEVTQPVDAPSDSVEVGKGEKAKKEKPQIRQTGSAETFVGSAATGNDRINNSTSKSTEQGSLRADMTLPQVHQWARANNVKPGEALAQWRVLQKGTAVKSNAANAKSRIITTQTLSGEKRIKVVPQVLSNGQEVMLQTYKDGRETVYKTYRANGEFLESGRNNLQPVLSATEGRLARMAARKQDVGKGDAPAQLSTKEQAKALRDLGYTLPVQRTLSDVQKADIIAKSIKKQDYVAEKTSVEATPSNRDADVKAAEKKANATVRATKDIAVPAKGTTVYSKGGVEGEVLKVDGDKVLVQWTNKDGEMAGDPVSVDANNVFTEAPSTSQKAKSEAQTDLPVTGETQTKGAVKVGDTVENIIGGWKGTIAKNADGDLVVKRGKEVWGDYSPANYVPVESDAKSSDKPLRSIFPNAHPDEIAAVEAAGVEVDREGNLKRWFGDSKVVDEKGNPLRVYRGDVENKQGIFFTSSTDTAEGYTRSTFFRGGDAPQTTAVYLSLQNPLIIDALGKRNDNIPVPWSEWKPKVFGNLPDTAVSVEDAYAYALKNGYDGLIVRNVVDTADPTERAKPSDVYAVKEQNQVKSAIGNNGNFDPAEDSILRSINASVDANMLGTMRQDVPSITKWITDHAEEAGYKVVSVSDVSQNSFGKSQYVRLEGQQDGKAFYRDVRVSDHDMGAKQKFYDAVYSPESAERLLFPDRFERVEYKTNQFTTLKISEAEQRPDDIVIDRFTSKKGNPSLTVKRPFMSSRWERVTPPLFKIRSSEDVDALYNVLPYIQNTGDLLEFANGGTITDGELELSPYDAEVTRRLLAEVQKGTDVPASEGAVYNASTLNKMAKVADAKSAEMTEMGYPKSYTDNLDNLAKNLRTIASNAKHGILYTFDESLPEERFHLEDLSAGRTSKEAIEQMKQSPLWDASEKFNRDYGKLSDRDKASEIVAKLATDQEKAYGWDKIDNFEAERAKLFDTWIDGIIAQNNITNIEAFNKEFTRLGAIYAEAKTNKDRTNKEGVNGNTGVQGGTSEGTNETRGQSEEGDGVQDRAVQGEEGEVKFTPGGKEKESKVPKTLQKRGFPVKERIYTSTTNAERTEFANKQLDKGVDEAKKWAETQLDDENYNAGATGVVGINVLIQLGKEKRMDEFNKFADKLMPAYTDAGQMVQSLAIVSIFSPETAPVYLAKMAKKNGKTVTQEQLDKATDLAERMSESSQAMGVTEVAYEAEKQFNELLKNEIDELEKALNIARSEGEELAKKNKELRTQLAGKGRKIASLERKLEGSLPKTRLAGDVAKKVKEIDARKDDILARLAAKFGENPVLRMIAGGDNILRSSNPPIDQDVKDWATWYLGNNIGKITVQQFKDALNTITNGAFSADELARIHADAVNELRVKHTPMDAERRVATALRNSHYREADRLNEKPYDVFGQDVPKPARRFANAVVTHGIRNGFTPQEIWLTIARKAHPKVSDALKAFRVEFPDVTREEERQVIKRSQTLTNDVKAELDSATIQKKSEDRLSQEDIDLIKNERSALRNAQMKISREANTFYNSLVKSKTQVIIETLVNARRANLLTAVKTHFVNIGGNVGFGISEELSRVPSTMLDTLAGVFTGERTTTFAPKGIIAGFKSLIKQDETLANAKWDTPDGRNSGIQAALHVLKYGGSLEDLERLQHAESALSATFKGRIPKWIDNYVNATFRTLGAEDALFKVYAFRRHIEEQARAIALTEHKTDKSVNVKERTAELIANPTNVMQVLADQYAHFMTFQNDNIISTKIAGIKRSIGYGGKAAVETIMPYDRTPTNIVLRALEYTPAGYAIGGAKFIIGKRRGISSQFRNDMTGAAITDVAQDFASLPDTEKRQLVEAMLNRVYSRSQQEQFAKTMGRASVGTGLFTLGFVLAAAGLMAGSMSPDDKDRKETSEFFRRMQLGVDNSSLAIPGVGRITLPKSPATVAMTAGATLYEQMIMSKNSPTKAAIDASNEAFWDLASEQPLINSTTNLMRTFGKGKFGEFTGNLLSGFVPASAMVRSISEVGDAKARTGSGYKKGEKIVTFEDSMRQQQRGFKNSFLRGIPVARNYFVDESTAAVSDAERGGAMRRFIRQIDPFNFRSKKDKYVPPKAR